MELKLATCLVARMKMSSLNRTFMELKYCIWEGAKALEFVLIVPLWN